MEMTANTMGRVLQLTWTLRFGTVREHSVLEPRGTNLLMSRSVEVRKGQVPLMSAVKDILA